VYESEVEREFAKRLDERDDIKLFVKLPGKFEIDTPVGKYNPDWAIVKHDGLAVYLVRETKEHEELPEAPYGRSRQSPLRPEALRDPRHSVRRGSVGR
jgi:restriction endonuclease